LNDSRYAHCTQQHSSLLSQMSDPANSGKLRPRYPTDDIRNL